MGAQRVYVVAGSKREAEDWARDSGIPRQQIEYVARHDQMRGLDRVVIAFVGTWRDRADATECALNAQIIRHF